MFIFWKARSATLPSCLLLIGLAAICRMAATESGAFGQDPKAAAKVRKVLEANCALDNLTFAPDGKNLIFSQGQATKQKSEYEIQLVLFDPTQDKELRRSPAFRQKFGLGSGYFSADGTMLVFDGWGGDPLVWDLGKWEIKGRLSQIDGHLGNRRPIGISHDGKMLLGTYQTADSKKGSLVRLDLGSGVHSIVGQEDFPGPAKALFLEYGNTLVLAEYNFGDFRGVYLWDLAQNRKLPAEIFRVPEDGLGVLSDKQRFVLAPGGRVVVLPKYRLPVLSLHVAGGVINLQGGGKHCGEIADFRGGSFLSQCLSADGRLLAAYGPKNFGPKQPAGSRLVVWDLTEVSAAAEKDAQGKNPADVEVFLDELFASPNPDQEKTVWEYLSQVKTHTAMLALAARPKEAVAGIKKQQADKLLTLEQGSGYTIAELIP
jgi:hypothetical protein